MTSLSRALAGRANRYGSLSNFYRADSRRRSSREQDVGLWWRVGAHGPVYRAAWVRETGEFYVTRLGPLQDGRGEVVVLGRARERSQLEEVLRGWQDVCPRPDSMTWLRHRAASLEPAEKAAPPFGRASVSHRLEDGRVSRPRRGDTLNQSPGASAGHQARPSFRPKAAVPSLSSVAARERGR
jgi:hypothetical protein